MLVRALAAALVFGAAAYTPGPSKPLNCDTREAVALKTAPVGTTRVSTNELRVRWRGGTRVFRDSGIVAGDMGGIDYHYCGYDPVNGFHLIFKHEDDLFAGVLLEHATGRLLPAGQLIVFAPDHDRYLATEQRDGHAVEDWRIYSIRHGELWAGPGGMSVRDSSGGYDLYNAELTKPRWSAQGELEATLTCIGNKHAESVTLRRQGNGFAWRPTIACKAGK